MKFPNLILISLIFLIPLSSALIDNPTLPKIISNRPTTVTTTSSGGNVSGLDSAVANATYLKLDASNDPITGALNISIGGNSIVFSDIFGFGVGQYCYSTLCGFLRPDITSYLLYNPVLKDLTYIGDTWTYSAQGYMTRANVSELNVSNINQWIDGDCPTGNFSYGLYANGSFKCRSDTSGGSGGGTNYYFYNNTNLNYNTSLTFNTSSIMEAGYTGTAGSFATLSYLTIGSGSTTATTSYNNRLKNVTYDGWVKNLKVVRNSAGADMNVTLYVNGTATTLFCQTDAGTFVTCQNLTDAVRVRAGNTWAVGIRSSNATTLTAIGVSFEYVQEQRVNFTTNVNVSAPVTPFTRDTTSCSSLDTVFQNNRPLPISVQGSISTDTKGSGDQAEVKIFVGANPPTTQVMEIGIRNNELASAVIDQRNHGFNFDVAPYENYTLTSAIAGSGGVTLTYCNEVTS